MAISVRILAAHGEIPARDRIAQQGGVVEKIRDELAGMNGVERRQIAPDQAVEHVALDVGADALAQGVDQRLLAKARIARTRITAMMPAG